MDVTKKERAAKQSQKASRCGRKIRQAEYKAYHDPNNGKAGVWRTPIFHDDIAHWNKCVPYLSDKWLKFIIQYEGTAQLLSLPRLKEAVLAEIANRTLLGSK